MRARVWALLLCLTAVSCQRQTIVQLPQPQQPQATSPHPQPTPQPQPAETQPVPAIADELDQSNMPEWAGGWSIIGKGTTVVRFAQTFMPQRSRLTAIEIDVLTGNRGRGDDVITASILDGDRVLAAVSQSVREGFDGVLRFEFLPPGLMVTPGAPLRLVVEDTNRDVFGWRYGLNTYPQGVALFNGVPWNNGVFDFRFRTYGY